MQPWKIEDKADSQQIGQCVSWKVVTSSAGGFTGGGAITWLRYGVGLDKKQELFSQAVDFDMIEQAGAWYTCNFALENIEEVREFLQNDPYSKVNLFEKVKIVKFKKVL